MKNLATRCFGSGLLLFYAGKTDWVRCVAVGQLAFGRCNANVGALLSADGKAARLLVAAKCCQRLALAADDFGWDVSGWITARQRLERRQRALGPVLGGIDVGY